LLKQKLLRLSVSADSIRDEVHSLKREIIDFLFFPAQSMANPDPLDYSPQNMN
jgi:hypothetical protein